MRPASEPPTERRRARLRSLLAAHKPDDAQEAEHLRRMHALLEVRGDPFSRTHFDPGHFTASAFILSPDRRQLLLIFHSKLQRWLQPGGHVEPADASLEAAALREVAEEVGLSDVELAPGGPIDVDVHEIPARKNDPAHCHFDVRFALQARSLAFRAASDAVAGRWMALEDIDERESDRSVMRAVEKLRAR